MKRRVLLGAVASGIAGGTAGCIGSGGGGGGGDGGDGGDGGGETPTTATTATTTTTTTATETATTAGTPTPVQEVENSISTVRQLLGTALASLSPSPTPTEGQRSMSEFEPDPYRERIATIQSSLDSAENAGPTDQQRETITRLRAIADFVTAYVDFLVPVKRATEAFLAADGARTAGEYDAAGSSLKQTKTHLEEARSRLETVVTRSDEVAQYIEVGSAPYGGNLQDLRGEPSEWERRFAVLTLLVEGQIRLVDALRSYGSGVEEYENGNYGAASDAFSTAETAAGEAKTRFDDVTQRSLVASIGTDASVLSCRSGAVRAAAESYVDAADAASAGDTEAAGNARNEAQDAFDRDC